MSTLGSFAWSAALRAARALGWQVPKPQPKFGHGSEAMLHTRDGEPVVLLGCYHVSQRNTQTGALTVEMRSEERRVGKEWRSRGKWKLERERSLAEETERQEQ